MNRPLIRNARMVNEGREVEGDLRIRGDRIEMIGADLDARPGEIVRDARGQWLLPGVIDAQVHFREPGMEYKGDLDTEPAAAVAGGITSYPEMPNTRPPTLDNDALEDKYRRAAGRSRANFGFYFGASNDNLENVKRIDPSTTPGLKIFMGASTGNMFADLVLVDPDAPFVVRREEVLSKCGWSPFEGETFNARVAATYVNGELAWDGRALIAAPQGRRLVFQR